MMKIEDLIEIAENFTEQHPVLPESNLILKTVQKSLAVQVQLALIFLTKKVIQSKKMMMAFLSEEMASWLMY